MPRHTHPRSRAGHTRQHVRAAQQRAVDQRRARLREDPQLADLMGGWYRRQSAAGAWTVNLSVIQFRTRELTDDEYQLMLDRYPQRTPAPRKGAWWRRNWKNAYVHLTAPQYRTTTYWDKPARTMLISPATITRRSYTVRWPDDQQLAAELTALLDRTFQRLPVFTVTHRDAQRLSPALREWLHITVPHDGELTDRLCGRRDLWHDSTWKYPEAGWNATSRQRRDGWRLDARQAAADWLMDRDLDGAPVGPGRGSRRRHRYSRQRRRISR